MTFRGCRLYFGGGFSGLFVLLFGLVIAFLSGFGICGGGFACSVLHVALTFAWLIFMICCWFFVLTVGCCLFGYLLCCFVATG